MYIVEENLSSESIEDNKQIEDIILDRGLNNRFFTSTRILDLPSSLGAAKNGKLSTSQLLALFVFIIPIAIPEMYIDIKSEKSTFAPISPSFDSKPLICSSVQICSLPENSSLFTWSD
ncbi:hypothetical protein VP01_722g4 [Puccinia sorghi]|uniref:Uncharacterized protein n=1 Tax=Puccinia sorghi TaxID=27349 RepID=A0A0L6UD57_9BASI|nr:hypothetical protein VP01_722g4 [Puccinia sorghi]